MRLSPKITMAPCPHCKKVIESAGVKKVVYGYDGKKKLKREEYGWRLLGKEVWAAGPVLFDELLNQDRVAHAFARNWRMIYSAVKRLQHFVYSRYAAWRFGKELAVLRSKLETIPGASFAAEIAADNREDGVKQPRRSEMRTISAAKAALVPSLPLV